MSGDSTPIAIFASGRGSNFDAVMAAVREGRLNARVAALVCDQPGAPVLEKARAAGIPELLVPRGPRKGSDSASVEDLRERHEREIVEKLKPYAPRFVVMAGYMRIVTPFLIECFRSERGYSRIVNIHPSLLPSFPGVNSYEQAFLYGSKLTGATVHLVEHEVDSGPICAQEAFSIEDCRSVEEVEKRGLEVEHRLFPETLSWVLPENFEVMKHPGGRLCVRKN